MSSFPVEPRNSVLSHITPCSFLTARLTQSDDAEMWAQTGDQETPSINVEFLEQDSSLFLSAFEPAESSFAEGPHTPILPQTPNYPENPLYLTTFSRMRSSASDSGSDSQSISSGQSSPSSSPYLSPRDGPTYSPYSPTADLEPMANLDLNNTEGLHSPFVPGPWNPYLTEPTSSTPSSSNSSTSNFNNPQDPSCWNTPSPHAPSPVLLQPGSSYLGPSPPDVLSFYQVDASPLTPFLDEHYLSRSRSPQNLYAHQGTPPFPHPPEFEFNRANGGISFRATHMESNLSSAIDMPEILGLVKDVTDGRPSQDALGIQQEVVNQLSSGGVDRSRLQDLFSKQPKGSVSTPAGRRASQDRRKHVGKFACHFLECDASFTRKLGLDNHLKSHLGIADQECEFCKKRFATSLNRHRKRCKHNPNHETTKKPKPDVIC